MTNKESKETKVRITNYKDAHFSKVSKVHVTNKGEGGGGSGGAGGGEFDGTIPWDSVTDKPDSFPPESHDHDEYSLVGHNHDDKYAAKDHDHDGRYYTKSEIENMDFSSLNPDNVTIVVENDELVAKTLDGLTVGTTDISKWLAGTEGNIQTQIDSIGTLFTGLVGGMHYRGKEETYAELMAWTIMEHGDLVVVLSDESRNGGRSMYVYTQGSGWDFVGEFTFSDEFTALRDTPSSYNGADGKVVKVAGERLVFDDVDYDRLKNKPSSTVAQIDDAVTKAHTHANKGSLDEISESSSGILTYKGEEYVRKSDFKIPQRKFLSAFTEPHTTVSKNNFLQFQKLRRGSNLPYDTSTGIFELEIGKSYEVTVNMLLAVDRYATFGLATESKSTTYFPYAVMYGSASNVSNRGSSGSLNIVITPDETTGTRFGVLLMNESSENSVEMREKRCSLVVKEL